MHKLNDAFEPRMLIGGAGRLFLSTAGLAAMPSAIDEKGMATRASPTVLND